LLGRQRWARCDGDGDAAAREAAIHRRGIAVCEHRFGGIVGEYVIAEPDSHSKVWLS
jgi:hypothetical protein